MYQRILVPIDGSSTAADGLEEAIELAALTGAQLRLVHVLEELGYASGSSVAMIALTHERGATLLAEAAARARAAGLKVETKLLASHTASRVELLLTQLKVWDADLVVIGTHGRRGVSRLVLGSDAEQLARLSTVPVLLVRRRQASDG